MRLRSKKSVLSLVLLAVSVPDFLTAQTNASGGLTGVVTDQSGAVLPNAQVQIKNNSKGTTQGTKTDREGVYRFFFLAPGRYTFTVTLDRFREEMRIVSVLLGPPGTLNVSLKLAKTSTEITVTGEAPIIHAENGDVSATMNESQISDMPNPGNDLTYIAQAAPGAIMNTDMIAGFSYGNFSILGMPGTSNLFTLNGMNNNNIQVNTNNSGALGMMLGLLIDPELARVGMNESEAKRLGIAYRLAKSPAGSQCAPR